MTRSIVRAAVSLAAVAWLASAERAEAVPLDCSGFPGEADTVDLGDLIPDGFARVCTDFHVDDLDNDGTGGEPGDVVIGNLDGLKIELANSISHELGHLLGLTHDDGTTQADLMDVDTVFDGDDRSFSAASIAQVVANTSVLDTITVWLDFYASSDPNAHPFSNSPVQGLNQQDGNFIVDFMDDIVALVEADYQEISDAFGADFFFTVFKPVTGDYETVEIMSQVPEPAVWMLLGLGSAALSRRRGRA